MAGCRDLWRSLGAGSGGSRDGEAPPHRAALLAAGALLSSAAAAVAGAAASLAKSYAPGQHGSHFSAFWACAFALVLSAQAALVAARPDLAASRRRRAAWLAYTAWMAAVGLVTLVGLGIALPDQVGYCTTYLSVL